MTDQLASLVVLANITSTLVLVGLIWFVQVVHYPQFAHVGKDHFADYQAAHVRSTTWVVALPMLVEAVTSAVLAWSPPSQELAFACWIGLALVVAIWLSTILLQVPKHNALREGFDSVAHHGLVRSNWIRTICWSGRGALCLYILLSLLGGSIAHGR